MNADQNLAYTLPAHAQYHLIRYHLIRTLNTILPPPADDLPGAETRRNDSLITRIAALQPASSAENDLAAQAVVAHELWMDSVLLSRDPEQPLSMKIKCRAQAASMMRQTTTALRELKRLQAECREIESDPETSDRGKRIEHITVLLNEGVADPETVATGTARPPRPHTVLCRLTPRA